jgi:hypothetical protein
MNWAWDNLSAIEALFCFGWAYSDFDVTKLAGIKKAPRRASWGFDAL